MKKLEAVEAFLEKIKNDYNDQVIGFSQKFFDTHIKPRCDKYELNFYSGNGDFYFEKRDGSKTYDIDEIPSCFRLSNEMKTIFSMTMENYHMPCNNFGSLCNQYTPKSGDLK